MSVSVAAATTAPAPRLPQGQPARHVPALDGLRGLAILLVVVHHFILVTPSTDPLTATVRNVLSAGWIGVDLFFVLSGFLITGILLDAKPGPTGDGTGYFRNFYARRILRIFPLYYAALALILIPLTLRAALATTPTGLSDLLANQRWLWCYGTNMKMAATGQLSFGPLSHFWSLAVEEHFYLLWPLLVRFLPRRPLMLVCLALMAGALALRTGLVMAGANWLAIVFLTPCRVDALALGALIAALARSPGGLWRLRRPARRILPGTGLLLAALFLWRGGLSYESDPVLQTAGLTLLALFFGSLLILVVRARGRLRRLFTHPLATALGQYSYGLYVVHFPILVLLFYRLDLMPRLLQWLGHPLLAGLAQVVLGSALSLVAAMLSYHLFEKHFLKLKTRFEYRPTTPQPQPEPIVVRPAA